MDDAIVRFDIGLDHHRHGCQLLPGKHRGGFRTGDGTLPRFDHDCRCRNRFALPTFHLGRCVVARVDALERWIAEQEQKPPPKKEPAPRPVVPLRAYRRRGRR
jgi:hypothetical protein